MFEFVECRVADVMTTEVITLRPESTLREAEQVIEQRQINGCPVVDATGAVVGLLTAFDVLSAFRFESHAMMPRYDDLMAQSVATVMNRSPVTVTPELPLTRVLERMLALRNSGFPVVDGGRLVGMVTRQDLVRALRRTTSPASR